MRRSKQHFRNPTLPVALILACFATTAIGAGEPVWPSPPADPLVRLESVLGKLNNFEVAIQGPIEGRPKTVRKLVRPSGVAFDTRGRLLVSDSRQSAVLQIDTDLGVVLVFGTGTTPSLREPRGLAVDADGTIYVADAGLRQVVAFEAGGRVAAVYGEGTLEEPTDVALSPDGSRLYVADASANSIDIFDVASRRRVDSLGRRGTGVGEFYLPTAVEFDRAGGLLVVDQLNGRVQVFNPSGALDRFLELGGPGDTSRPQDIAAAGSGKLFVTDSAQSRIQVYDSGRSPLLTFGRNGLGEGEFLEAGGIAIRGDRLAVLDKAGGRVQLFRLFGEQKAPPAVQRRAQSTWEQAGPEPADESPTQPAAAVPAPAEPGAEAVVEDSSPPLAPRAAGEPDLTVEPLAGPGSQASADAARVAQQLLELVESWAAAWSAQDANRYLGFYSEAFQPADGSSLKEWLALRRSRVRGPASISVEIEILETRLDDDAEVIFVQSYKSDRYSDRVRKSLRLVREAGSWKIARETVLETGL